MPNAALAYTIGEPDMFGRYPVLIGTGVTIGFVSRWHREWDTESSAGAHRVGRPAVGQKGADKAADYLIGEYAAGRITPIPAEQAAKEAAERLARMTRGPVPLLDPRMKDTPTNRDHARAVVATARTFRWMPLAGFPGSDNLWLLRCELECTPGGWTGVRHWSKLRGRNGKPPTAYRHPGCLSEDEVRALVPAYGPGKSD
jgi:hypothetical protein